MKLYLQTIQILQKFFLGISILVILFLPIVIVFKPNFLSGVTIKYLYLFSHFTVLLVMIIRPLADIFSKIKWVRPLVILRKSVGVLSASIIISFIFSKIIVDPSGYFLSFATAKYWSIQNLALLAHLADISAILLLITSNSFSKRILGDWWKRIQRLSYVYFYASSTYILVVLSDKYALNSMIIVTVLTILAFMLNRLRTRAMPEQTI